MYRFAFRPRWLLSHLLVLALVVALCNLGLWQLRRLDERRTRNAEVAARIEQVPDDFFAIVDDGTDPEQVRFRRATVSGTYDPTTEVLVDNRTLDGLPGAWVLTPLITDGGLIAVNRGFARVGENGKVTAPAAPVGEVVISGHVVAFVGRSCPTRTDDDGRLVGTACLDRTVIETAVGESVAPLVLQATESQPPDDVLLSAVPLPEPGDGSHLSYAVQWFIFMSVAVIGYPLILRKNARERSSPLT